MLFCQLNLARQQSANRVLPFRNVLGDLARQGCVPRLHACPLITIATGVTPPRAT